MRNPFGCCVGGVVGADVAVPEHERELEFYSAILRTGGEPLWRDDLTNNFGTPIIGLGVRTPEYESLPLQWMPHFQVADVAASVASAVEMGGKELFHGKTEAGESQWAVLADQNGAAFGVIPVVAEDSGYVQQTAPCGCIAWLSLIVPDAFASRDFYQRVIGWTAEAIGPEAIGPEAIGSEAIGSEDNAGQNAAFELHISETVSAAEIKQRESHQDGIPTVWLIHLPVGDLAESLRRVREHGGYLMEGDVEAGYAVIRDPVGVFLALQAG